MDYTKVAKEAPEKLPWYIEDVTHLDAEGRKVFVEYSKIPPNEVEAHIKSFVCARRFWEACS